MSSTAASAQPHQNGQSSKNFKRGRRARSTLRSFLGKFAHRGNSLQDLRPSPRFPHFPHICFIFCRPSAALPSGPFTLHPPVRQFVEWEQPRCARWLDELGFQCDTETVRSGRHLLNMNDGDMERELGIRSALQVCSFCVEPV